MMQFKTGSTASTFKGNAQAYRIGKITNPGNIRIVQETLIPDRYHFFAFYGAFSDGSLITITSTRPFNYVGGLSVNDPTGSSYAQVPIYTLFNQQNLPAITDIVDLPNVLDNIYYKSEVINLLLDLRRISLTGTGMDTQSAVNINWYRIGTLVLPQGGHHAWIKVLLLNGMGVSNMIKGVAVRARNYVLDIYIYSSNGLTSIALQNSSQPNNGCFHHGQVFCSSLIMQPLGVALVPHATDPDVCYIWVRSYTWHGTPLVVGVQTSIDGYFEPAPFTQSASLPAIGSVPLNISTLFTTSTPVGLLGS
jgi:hypothetical protein